VKTFTFPPLLIESVPLTVVTSVPTEPKVTAPELLKVRLLNVVLPLICGAEPFRIIVPKVSEKPEAPPLLIHFPPTVRVLIPEKVSDAPELMVIL